MAEFGLEVTAGTTAVTSALGHILDTEDNYPSGILLSLRNFTVEKASIDFEGTYTGHDGIFGGKVTVAETLVVTGALTANAFTKIVFAGTDKLFEIVGGGTGGTFMKFTETGTKGWILGLDDANSSFKFREDTFDGTVALELIAGGDLRITRNTGLGIAVSSTTFAAMGAATTAKSSLRAPHGTAPSSPVNGDIWTTTSGLFARINGSTVGPFTA